MSSRPHHNKALTVPTVVCSLLAIGLVGCGDSDDDSGVSPTPDTTAPAASSFVQNRTADATGQTISVNFSEAVTAVTAEVTASYTISGGVNVTAAALSMDGMTVNLTLDAPAIPGDNTIAIAAGVADAAGNTSVEVTATALTSTDTTAPAASSIAGTTISGAANDTIDVVFSDNMIQSEVETVGNWTIESPQGSAFDTTGATVAYNDTTQSATITLGAGSLDQNLQTFDDIHATFAGMRDLGGNQIGATIIGTTAIAGDVEGDVTPPTLMAAAPGTGDTVTLTFSENVSGLETVDLAPNMTDIVLTDANAPGDAAAGGIGIGGTVVDGDSITISDGVSSQTFEFDYGAQGTISLSGLPADTDTIVIGDGSASVTFEYDNNSTSTGTSVLIGADAPTTIATLMSLINSSALTITASAGATTSDINLRHDAMGVGGNVLMSEVDTNAVQTFTGMAGGGISGDIAVAVDTSSIATTVTSLRAAIDGNAFDITTSNGGSSDDFLLANDNPGLAGNVPITESDANGVITGGGMTGGTAGGIATFDATASTAQTDDLQATVTFAVTPEAADSLRIFGVTDLAGNQMMPMTAASVVALDTTIPALDSGNSTVTTSTGENNDSVLVKFNATIHPDGATNPANYTLAGASAIDLSNASFSFDQADEVTIQFDAASNVNIATAAAHTIEVNNLRNLQGAERTSADVDGAITPTGDSAAPTIGATDARLDPNDATMVIVTFSESISETGGIDTANYTIVGNTASAATFITPRVVQVTFTSTVAVADSLDIAVAAATDLAGNAAGGVATVAITAADAVIPTLDTVAATVGQADGRDQVKLTFSEPVPTAISEVAGNYTITSGGAAVSLVGASFQDSSIDDSVTIRLANGVRLLDGDAIAVTPANLTDAAGNAVAASAVNGTVAGDSTAPTAANGFVNFRADAAAMTIDVQFEETMDLTVTGSAANWTGSNGQTGATVTMLNPSLFRVTFDGPIGASDTVDITSPTDAAGNQGGTITVAPIE